ncbi:MAG: EamA family transporter [Thermoanaerobaculia bacterium]|nr:EamA family transporter [Thermoanaerobaculia bacterium]
MPELWILLALAAGTFQTARNALANSLAGRISPALNSWSRFAFNLPFSLALVGAVVAIGGMPRASPAFFLYCLGTGVTQLVGNVALIGAFRRSEFAESIVLHKLEVAMAAVVGVLFFAESPTAGGWAGIVLCTAGVLLINLGRPDRGHTWRHLFHLDAGAALALSAGLMLVFASFFLKAATREFAAVNPDLGPGSFAGAVHTLVHTTWMEVAILTAFLVATDARELGRVREHWRRMLAIGLAGFSGSVCWFWAYSLALVAYVKAVGQVETVLSVILGLTALRELRVRRQLPGIGLIVTGIVLVLLL